MAISSLKISVYSVTSNPITLNGRGWDVVLGRQKRYEIEGVWRPQSKEEAAIVPYKAKKVEGLEAE